MSVLFLVLPLALLASAVAVAAFAWAVRNGQMDDLTTPALRMLEEDTGSSSRSRAKLTNRQAERESSDEKTPE